MLRIFYVFYYAVVGVSTPFFGAYLRRIGLSGQAVSAVLSVAPALQLGVPLAWGWLADRCRQPHRVLRILCLGASVTSIPLIFTRSMPAILLVYGVQQVFAGSVTALADSMAVEAGREAHTDYGQVRLWGSLSFSATCLVTGAVLDARDVRDGDPLVPALIAAGFALSFLATLAIRGSATWDAPHLRDVRGLLRTRPFRLLLVAASLHWLALSPFNGFFGVLVQDRGMPATTTSYAFLVGAAAEIVVFARFRQLRAVFQLPSLLIASFAVTVVHWLVVASTRTAFWVIGTQALHAMTFGLFWATSMAWVGECVPTKLRATGQMLFSTTLGVGATVGLLAAGKLYDLTGGAGTSFYLAALLELVPLTLVVVYWSRGPRGANELAA